jgi:phage major head subunit gpT-like protein
MSLALSTTNLAFFFTTVEARFFQAYKTTPVWRQRLATEIPIKSEQYGAGWTGMLERPRRWNGPRVVRQVAPLTYFVNIGRPYELTWGIDVDKLDDDMHGIYASKFAQHGAQNAKWADYELRDLIFNLGEQTGNAQLGTDGLTHWHTAHPVDVYDASKGTYANDFRSGGVTVDGVNVGGGISVNAFNTLWAEMGNRKSESGEALGIEPDLCVSSTFLKQDFATILNTQFMAPPVMGNLGTGAAGTANAPFVGAMENPLKGWTDYEAIKDFGISSATKKLWLMLQTKDLAELPLLWLMRMAPQLTPRVSPTDPAVFDTNQYLYGSKMRGAPAWGLPFLSSISGPA